MNRLMDGRRRVRRAAFGTALALTVALLAPALRADDSVMDAEIDHLLTTVAASGCVFIRNGDEHEAHAARDHLQMKRRRGRRYYGDTEEFIEKIASRSSWSGKPYTIRCGNDEQTAAAWFTAALTRYRTRQQPARP